MLNFPSQPVITKDNVTIDIDAVLYYRVADPQKATYSVQNLPYALETLTRTTLRNIVGDIELDQTLASRDMINRKMREVIEEASIGWGVDVTRVELQSIEPPRDIQQSMELQMRAERERRAAVTNAEASKRAAILESEGQKEAQIRKAEGEKGAAILRAEGLATARLAMADAEAEAVKRITAALPPGEVSTYLLGLRYIDALPQIAQGKGTTIFLPSEATGVLGAIGGMREMLRATVGAAAEKPPRRSAVRSAAPGPPSGQDHARARGEDREGSRLLALPGVHLPEAHREARARLHQEGARRGLDRGEGLRRVRLPERDRHRGRRRHRLRELSAPWHAPWHAQRCDGCSIRDSARPDAPCSRGARADRPRRSS